MRVGFRRGQRLSRRTCELLVCFSVYCVGGMIAEVHGEQEPVGVEVAARYWSKAEVFDGRGLLFDNQFPPVRQVYGLQFNQPNRAEMHVRDTDVIFVLDGLATVVTGGEIVEPQSINEYQTFGSAIRGGKQQVLSKGDVMIIPAGTPHWFEQVDRPISFLAVQMREEEPVNSASAMWWSGVELPGLTPLVHDAREKGRGYQVFSVRREGAGVSEFHQVAEDIIFVLSGSARFVTSGTIVEPQSPVPGEIFGEAIEGGQVHELSAGDLVIVPQQTPHWFQEVSGEVEYLALKVVFSDPNP